NDLTTLEPQQLLSGSISATVLIGEGTQISAALFGTKTIGPFNQAYSLFDASVQHRFTGGEVLAVRGRQSIFAPSNDGKEFAYLAEFSIPLAVPIARKTESGRLTGKVVDSEKGTGIQGVLVYAGGATALTDRNGEYHFVSLKPDKYYVQLDMASIGLNRVASQQLPHEVTIVGGKEERYDISLTRAIGVSGVVLIFGMKDQAPGDTSQPQLIEQGGHPNVILELSNPQESARRVSDNKGRFSFAGIRPGKWTLRILEGNLPQNTYFDKDSYVIDAAPGASMEFTFKALPRKRRIQILQQGKTLEAPPQKGKAPEAVPPKTKRNESAPKAKVIEQTPKKDNPSTDAPR
ncbi:MAG: carboxypeptidase-like regulatory domain-containing protein, partial [Ignavibacteriales bacterium]|nr:carboxypeptidase-like regulatory domain-containing protein [Ignavibacteriales bacterium]